MGKSASKFDEADQWEPPDYEAESSAERNTDDDPDMEPLKWFLFMGSDSYKADNKEPERRQLECIDGLIRGGKGKDVVRMLAAYSDMGRTPRQQYIIYALAVCARSNDAETKKMAYECLPKICRIPTHLFMFLFYCKQESSEGGKHKGWGRAHRRAVIKWYQDKCRKNPLGVARLLTKYKERQFTMRIENSGEKIVEKWSHKDVFCLAHPSGETNDVMKVILRFVMKHFKEVQKLVQEEMGSNDEILKMLSYLEATEKAMKCTDEDIIVQLIKDHELEREHIPTQMLKSALVYEAVVMNMKPEAKLRNLCLISHKGLCKTGSAVEEEIVDTLRNRTKISDARVHPFRILLALKCYEKSRGNIR